MVEINFDSKMGIIAGFHLIVIHTLIRLHYLGSFYFLEHLPCLLAPLILLVLPVRWSMAMLPIWLFNVLNVTYISLLLYNKAPNNTVPAQWPIKVLIFTNVALCVIIVNVCIITPHLL